MTAEPKEQTWWPLIAALVIPAALVVMSLFLRSEDDPIPVDRPVSVVVRVVDAAGDPAGGREVRLLPGAGDKTVTATTDSAGYATASLPRRGTLSVSVAGGPPEPRLADLGQYRTDQLDIVITLPAAP